MGYLLPFNRNPNPLVEEPRDNVFGPFKVFRRTDGLFVVHNTRPTWPATFGPVYRAERDARIVAAQKMAAEAKSALT